MNHIIKVKGKMLSLAACISELIITSVGQSVIHFRMCLVDEKGNSLLPLKKHASSYALFG